MDFDAFQAAVTAHPLVLAWLTAPDCRVCDALRPKVDAILARHGAWRKVFVDLSVSPEVSGQLTVFSVPTIVLYTGGRQGPRFGRALLLDDLEATIERYEDLFGRAGEPA